MNDLVVKVLDWDTIHFHSFLDSATDFLDDVDNLTRDRFSKRLSTTHAWVC